MNNVQIAFETFWSKRFAWEISRGLRGRNSYQLDKYEGKYISDRVRDAFEMFEAGYRRAP